MPLSYLSIYFFSTHDWALLLVIMKWHPGKRGRQREYLKLELDSFIGKNFYQEMDCGVTRLYFEGPEGQRSKNISVRHFRWYFGQAFGGVIILDNVTIWSYFIPRPSASSKASSPSELFLFWWDTDKIVQAISKKKEKSNSEN